MKMIKIDREIGILINTIIDDFIPPFIRDSIFFLPPIFRLLFRSKAYLFKTFRHEAFKMSEKDFYNSYRIVDSVLLTSANKRITDINKKCIKKILSKVVGKKILDVGVGKAYLANLLSSRFAITGVDIAISKELIKKHAHINFVEANIESLPFKDKSFDTVICAHTLEHVLNIVTAVLELRRVAKRRLIIILPKERPYKFGFNLHLHFFPYPYSIWSLFGYKKNRYLSFEGGDWFYIEDF